jgi:hypothetical protein
MTHAATSTNNLLVMMMIIIMPIKLGVTRKAQQLPGRRKKKIEMLYQSAH